MKAGSTRRMACGEATAIGALVIATGRDAAGSATAACGGAATASSATVACGAAATAGSATVACGAAASITARKWPGNTGGAGWDQASKQAVRPITAFPKTVRSW